MVASGLGSASRASSKDIFWTLLFCKGKDGMARGGFNSLHFSFKSTELSRKNSSNSKVKADALWEEQDTLIYGNWNRKCGLRMTMRNKITWLG